MPYEDFLKRVGAGLKCEDSVRVLESPFTD